MAVITLQRADERFLTDAGWLHSRHSFNFGSHWSRENQQHAVLVVNNDDVVAPGQGFGTHGHRDMEIVSWVLGGRLEHRDSEGNDGLLYPGLAQRMSAGRGIRHSEMNPSADEPVHFVQMWVLPDTLGLQPSYEQLDLNNQLADGRMVPIASGKGHHGAISIHQRDAVLWGARLPAGMSVALPVDRYVHVFLALGGGDMEEVGKVHAGDGIRLTDVDELGFTAGAEGAELLVWAMD